MKINKLIFLFIFLFPSYSYAKYRPIHTEEIKKEQIEDIDNNFKDVNFDLKRKLNRSGDEIHDLQKITWADGTTDTSGAGLFEIDVNGDLMPVTSANHDAYFELDENDDIKPK